MRDARQKGLAAARENLEGMLASQRQLQVEIENLAARNATLAAAQTMSLVINVPVFCLPFSCPRSES